LKGGIPIPIAQLLQATVLKPTMAYLKEGISLHISESCSYGPFSGYFEKAK
jgi:hypothetical protein